MPLVAIFREPDSIAIPSSMEAIWAVSWRLRDINDNAIAREDASWTLKASRLTYRTYAFASRETNFTIHFVEECNDSLASHVVGISVCSNKDAAIIKHPRVKPLLDFLLHDGSKLRWISKFPYLFEQSLNAFRQWLL